MRIIKLADKEVKIMGTPMTAYLYKKEFAQTLSGDLIAMRNLEDDPNYFDDVNILQMIWAMAKTCDKNIKPFINWLEELDGIDISEIVNDVMEEATNACFRGNASNK